MNFNIDIEPFYQIRLLPTNVSNISLKEVSDFFKNYINVIGIKYNHKSFLVDFNTMEGALDLLSQKNIAIFETKFYVKLTKDSNLPVRKFLLSNLPSTITINHLQYIFNNLGKIVNIDLLYINGIRNGSAIINIIPKSEIPR